MVSYCFLRFGTRDTFQRLLSLLLAPYARVIRRPVHITAATRDCAIGQGLGTDDNWSRISHLSSSGSAGHRRAAAVQLSRQTPPRALQIQVRIVGAPRAGMPHSRHSAAAMTLATSALIAVTTPQCSPMDSMRIGHCEGPHTVPRPLQMGAADGKGNEPRLTGLYNGHS